MRSWSELWEKVIPWTSGKDPCPGERIGKPERERPNLHNCKALVYCTYN